MVLQFLVKFCVIKTYIIDIIYYPIQQNSKLRPKIKLPHFSDQK